MILDIRQVARYRFGQSKKGAQIKLSKLVVNTPWRDRVEEIVRPVNAEERERLERGIRENGIQVPLVIDEQNHVIDGITRATIAADLGLEDVPVEVRKGLTEDEKVQRAVGLNYERRHLSAAERGKVSTYLTEQEPKTTVREAAEKVGVSTNTVSKSHQKAGRSLREEKKAATREKVETALKENPEATEREIAEKAGVGKGTVSRVKKEVAPNVTQVTNGATPEPEPLVEELSPVTVDCYICNEPIAIHETDAANRPIRGKGDNAEKYWQFGQGWILQQGWPNASNHIKGIRWSDRFIHHECLDSAIKDSLEKEGM